jgi:hypothetical protein
MLTDSISMVSVLFLSTRQELRDLLEEKSDFDCAWKYECE